MSGGTLNTLYSVGLGYFTQEGIVGGDKSNFSRYNGRLNLSTKLSTKMRLNSVLLFYLPGGKPGGLTPFTAFSACSVFIFFVSLSK